MAEDIVRAGGTATPSPKAGKTMSAKDAATLKALNDAVDYAYKSIQADKESYSKAKDQVGYRRAVLAQALSTARINLPGGVLSGNQGAVSAASLAAMELPAGADTPATRKTLGIPAGQTLTPDQRLRLRAKWQQDTDASMLKSAQDSALNLDADREAQSYYSAMGAYYTRQ
jgi:hypothetical protein